MSYKQAPDLIHLYVKSCVIGFAAAAVFVALLLVFDVAGLGHLVTGSPVGVIAGLMMWIFNGIVFAGVQFGIVIMGMADDDDDDDDDGGTKTPLYDALPIPVRINQ